MAKAAKPIAMVFVLAAILSLPAITMAGQPGSGVISETLTVPFLYGTEGVQTVNSYSGRVQVKITGIGQASGAEWSDAFYVFTDADGNPIEPYHPSPEWWYNFTLWINDGPADSFVDPIPEYKPNHIYVVRINAPGGPLTFAVGDLGVDDNTGEYEIVVRDLPH